MSCKHVSTFSYCQRICRSAPKWITVIWKGEHMFRIILALKGVYGRENFRSSLKKSLKRMSGKERDTLMESGTFSLLLVRHIPLLHLIAKPTDLISVILVHHPMKFELNATFYNMFSLSLLVTLCFIAAMRRLVECLIRLLSFYIPSVPSLTLYLFSRSQGLDEEAIVDHGKSSFTTHTNYEREDLESKFQAKDWNVLPVTNMLFVYWWEGKVPVSAHAKYKWVLPFLFY